MAPAACSWPCLWIHAKLARNCLPKFPKRIPPLHWSTIAVKDGGCGLQLAVPNVTFWIHKKLAPNCIPKLPTRTPLLHWNTMAVKDGWRRSWPCLASLSENCLPKRMPPAACSWPCVTSLSESIHTKLGRTAYPSSQNGLLRYTETQWQWRTAPAACSWPCLTSASESTRN